ncbi:molybdopterin-containing oxidoreductase family protein [Raoultibacter massiliensis]|uniref:molybdopterin-containing oxidoreductase family protein n=1 Tax=Raoultibacter massiliensis TaxID=1852371 RepID=UPI003A8E70E5
MAYIERIYSPTRVKAPLRRAGERGADQWEQISWDEAIEEIASKLKEISDKYGPKAVFFDAASGQYGFLNGIYNPLGRLSGVMGATKLAVSYDYAAGHGIDRVLGTGDWAYSNEPNSVLDSSLVVIWGTNPVLCAPQNWRWMQWAHENGTRIIDIDPIKSATAHRADEWIPVTPGHDGYLALAMCNYLIEHDLINTEYLINQSTACFLVRKDTQKHLRKSDYEEVPTDPATKKPIDDFYVWDNARGDIALVGDAQDPVMEGSFTTSDGIEVDTAYLLLKNELKQYSISKASELTGVPEDRIAKLAEEFATERAVSVNITYGLDHYVNGYQNTWAIATLLALTGQCCRDGAGFTGVFTATYSPNTLAIWAGTPEFKELNSQIPNGLAAEVFGSQKLEGKDYPAKAMISYCSSLLSNQPSQKEWMEKVLPNIEFWVVLDTELNDSARYADIVLPVASWYEKEDVRVAYNNPYMTISEKAIEPLYESKPEWEIAGLIGRAMGYSASFPEGWSADDWMNLLFTDAVSEQRGFTLDRLKEEKVIRFTTTEEGKPHIRGMSAPLPTESKRSQLYCENPKPRLNWGQDLSEREPHEHIVYYQPPEEAGSDHPLAEKYPLVYIQEHSRFRVHIQWWETPLLRELDPEPLAKVNGLDAEARGVQNGDIVEVFNDRGHAVLKCLVDESIAPGVISIPKGWQRNQFIEGSYQEMTQPKIDPYPVASSFYDSRVDFRKWGE